MMNCGLVPFESLLSSLIFIYVLCLSSYEATMCFHREICFLKLKCQMVSVKFYISVLEDLVS